MCIKFAVYIEEKLFPFCGERCAFAGKFLRSVRKILENMNLNFYAHIIIVTISIADAFFLFGEQPEPVLFCIKVCPLYCSPRRRRDVGPSSIYWDEPPFTSHEQIIDDFPTFPDPYFFCKPTKKPQTTTTTTTTMAPTTEEPTWICMVCMKKCNYPRKT